MIQLKQVLPTPIKEMPGNPMANSEIFNNKVQFEKGKKYLITAPSGKGKSTFLHIIYGLRNDFDGEIFINDQTTHVFKSDDWSVLRQDKFSIVFQDLKLFLDLTAMENLMLKAGLKNFKEEADIKVMAELLGIESLLPKTVRTLSYGQRQRVAIIRALCQPFDFLLLDEPFSHLDEKNIAIASDLIEKEISSQKAGMILVSLGEKYQFVYDQELKI